MQDFNIVSGRIMAFGAHTGNAQRFFPDGLKLLTFRRGLVLEPYLATVIVAGGLIRDAGSAAQKEALLPAIAEERLGVVSRDADADGRFASAVGQTGGPHRDSTC